jgi:hypothetical protein
MFRRLDSVFIFRWKLLSWVQSVDVVPNKTMDYYYYYCYYYWGETDSLGTAATTGLCTSPG